MPTTTSAAAIAQVGGSIRFTVSVSGTIHADDLIFIPCNQKLGVALEHLSVSVSGGTVTEINPEYYVSETISVANRAAAPFDWGDLTPTTLFSLSGNTEADHVRTNVTTGGFYIRPKPDTNDGTVLTVDVRVKVS
jgi:hypothetical protein